MANRKLCGCDGRWKPASINCCGRRRCLRAAAESLAGGHEGDGLWYGQSVAIGFEALTVSEDGFNVMGAQSNGRWSGDPVRWQAIVDDNLMMAPDAGGR